jgi:EAL domain-containing protein (putative c-di-GMP-specific phosphodiesterase class I)
MRKVLLLDDDPTTLLLLSRHLQDRGFEVIACREIEAAEALLDHSRIDAVVTDLCLSPLGGLDGTRLVRHVCTHFPETEIFVMSSHASDEIRRLMLAFGAAAVLEKPVDPLMLVRQLLRGTADTGQPGVVHSMETLDDFLATNPIFAVLQPIVSLQDGGPLTPLHGVEALARAPRESLLRNPELLFGYASRKERLFETDMLCVKAALDEAARFDRSSRLFLNIQPRSMTRPGFSDGVERMVRAAGLRPSQVVFELTEQETILNPRAFAATLAEIRKRGFAVAMDDYGMGHSNLRFLLDFHPDYVKLSGYFCRGIAQDPVRREIVRSTRRLLGRLGIPSVMECVETGDELRVVRDLGVEYAQGYHFARPARAAELLETARSA